MATPLCAFAGECTVRERDDSETARELRGRVVVLVKPDDTVLVHDVDGYQPVAWLTRADGVTWERSPADGATAPADDAVTDPGPLSRVADRPTDDDPNATDRSGDARGERARDQSTDPSVTPTDHAAGDGDPAFSLTARKDRRVLLVTAHDEATFLRYDATAAGIPVGDCRCGGPLVRADGQVRCLDCVAGYGLPRDAAVLGNDCGCGLPRFAVDRGRRFELCLDRDCEHSRSMDEAVGGAFDREWACPECGADLRVLRRGGLILGCERYPDCDTGFAFPTGTLAGDCDCGLPAFETGSGRRCVDSTCSRPLSESDGSTLSAGGHPE